MARFLAVLLLLLAPSVVCSQETKPKPRRTQNLITTEEIELAAGSATDARDLIRQLRPGYLQGRSTTTRTGVPNLPKVSINGGPPTELETLRQIPAVRVREVRFLTASQATTDYGTGVEGGVIVVTLK